MKILHYTNRLQLIIDAIFRPSKIVNEIESDKRETIDKLTKDFTKRLALIRYDQYDNGVAFAACSWCRKLRWTYNFKSICFCNY